MKFEHLVQINDPNLPGIDWLTRQQLWFGLVARAWKPTRFVLGLEDAQVMQTSQEGNVTRLARVLNYGPFQIEDTMALFEEDRTETHIAANRFCGDSTLTISIEEPNQDELWLRFQYHVNDAPNADNPAGASSADVDEIRKQAYRAADVDTVRMIRELAMAIPQQAPGSASNH
ncbi:SRPBCC family protein [Limnobacter parvus]|uniref:SRPBCC family protein n=1 Tax=Limnobacter parvus TaxID=2939690 RepID=A0ABT1XG48_9BURK|nr:SRPBCC family protein [Limnobacter parvus]MCR2746255.1 SRPBCC family protein [Limnobacter parvus]